MEIRNALIMLTKISGVFPVTRKSGINLEKRVRNIYCTDSYFLSCLLCFQISFTIINLLIIPPVIQVAKIKSDEREDLKVLATGVAAALAARKVSYNINCA